METHPSVLKSENKRSFTNNGTATMKSLKVGDKLSYTSYITVDKINGSNLIVTDQRGIQFGIQQEYGENSLVDKTMHSSTYFEEEIKLSRTEVIEKLLSAGDAIFEVSFRRQVDPLEAFESIKTGNVLKSHGQQLADLKLALKGTTRVLTGHLLDTEAHMGRSLVYDLEKQSPRWVDHRSIDILILKGVKYIAK